MNSLLKQKKFIIIPIVVFLIIFVNAFFGHLIFDLGPEQDVNKYSSYIHLQPDWSSYPLNIIFYVTTVWSNPDSDSSPYYDDTIAVTLKTEYNQNELRYLYGKSYVELNHEFSDCQNIWKPLLYRYALDSINHQFDTLTGKQLGPEPYIVQYPLIPNNAYTTSEQKVKLESGYSQFIPICTSKDSTSYDYSVKINDKKLGFDVYFVTSSSQRENYHQNFDDFSFYPSCFGENFKQFSGTCENVSPESGLLIIIPDELNSSVTKITVNLHERI